MVIGSTREIVLRDLEHSRSSREAALRREREAAVQAVLQAAREDVSVTQTEDGAHIRFSAQLITLERSEFTALAGLLRAHAKGYPAESLMPLLDDLARAFRR